ncbi:sodium/proline symporter [Alkalispirochaeta americana]|uniref:Sodium/proline symporter n=1 Tax=Alkalispirochaeta americana TaxID=159291 RepID=A0A1N6UDC9_9SPIO|nr:sodium/proline symporter PutP [Alkalispirochaeta americana]SIQ63557.1 sodium/proline symporter [Alkalispirochaeta americana]
MAEANPAIVVTFVLYLVLMMAVGAVFYRRTTNLSDYILGGRKLNYWVTSLSAQASDMSGWLLMGLPGYAYLAGLEAFWIAFGLALGTYLNWRFVARRLRTYTEISGDSITLPDYFESRFRDSTRILRIVSSIFILVFFLVYTSSGFVAGAILFSAIFNLPYTTGLLIGVVVIIGYTFLGGFTAVSWTDFIQGILMFFAITIVPFIGFGLAGGPGETFEAVRLANPEFLNIFTATDGSPLGIIAIVSLLAWGLGYFGQPHILARFMAIRSADEVAPARKIASTWVVISLTGAVLVGLIGIASGEVFMPADANAEQIFIHLIDGVIPPLLAGIFLSAILAAIMSTADSQLLVTSSALTEDLYAVLLRNRASQTELVWISRFSVIAVAIIASLIAVDPESTVLGLVSYAWGGFGATFGPIVILSLFWRRMTRNGALAGLVAGGLTVIVWYNLSGGIFDLYEIVPGFLFSLAAIVGVSLLGNPPEAEITAEFDQVT